MNDYSADIWHGVAVLVVAILLELLRRVRAQVSEINDAVNERHTRKDADGKAPPKIYDLALENRENLKGISAAVHGHTARLDRHSDRLEEQRLSTEEITERLKSQGKTIDQINRYVALREKRKRETGRDREAEGSDG